MYAEIFHSLLKFLPNGSNNSSTPNNDGKLPGVEPDSELDRMVLTIFTFIAVSYSRQGSTCTVNGVVQALFWRLH